MEPDLWSLYRQMLRSRRFEEAVKDLWERGAISGEMHLGIGVHRALEAAAVLEAKGVSAGVLDLRTVAPLDREGICDAVSRSGRLLVVDEDYRDFGLSGEIAAVVLESGIPVRYGRVCTEGTIPYARAAEDRALPNAQRIVAAALKLMG